MIAKVELRLESLRSSVFSHEYKVEEERWNKEAGWEDEQTDGEFVTNSQCKKT